MSVRTTTLTVMVYAYTLCVMAGLGASITVDILAEIRRAPRAVACGFCSQFGLMPLLAFSLAVIFGLGDTESLALLLMGMCPGGVTSTLFVYCCRANVTISLVMTTLSNFAALFMMPLLLFVYARPPLVSGNKARVSFVTIIATLVVATTPAAFGWLLRRRKPKAGELLEKYATKFGFLTIVATLVVIFAWPAGDTKGVTLKAVLVMFLLSPCGFALGYAFASLLGLDTQLARTVSIETGIQQVGIAAAIAVNSFKDDQLDKMVEMMAIFGLMTFLFGIAWAALLRAFGLPPLEEPSSEEEEERDKKQSSLDNGDKGTDLEQELTPSRVAPEDV